MDYNQYSVQQYRQADLGSMTPERLIVALYERMMRDLEQARTLLADGDRPAFNTKVIQVQSIITELRTALDHSVGGDIALNLDNIYNYVFQELLMAIVDRDPKRLLDCSAVLQPLLEAWRQVPAGTAENARRLRSQGMDPDSGPDPATGGQDQRENRGPDGVAPAPQLSTLSVTV